MPRKSSSTMTPAEWKRLNQLGLHKNPATKEITIKKPNERFNLSETKKKKKKKVA